MAILLNLVKNTTDVDIYKECYSFALDTHVQYDRILPKRHIHAHPLSFGIALIGSIVAI